MKIESDSMKRAAVFSPDRVHRYALTRTWNEDLPALAVIGLNPSTADETLDDPTVRRCIGFAKREGKGGLVMLNLFALRSTDPQKLYEVVKTPGQGIAHAIGPKNDEFLLYHTRGRLTLCAWGNHGTLGGRGAHVALLLEGNDGKLVTAKRETITTSERSLVCFRLTKEKQPEHPLYQPNARPLVPFGRPA